MSMVPPGTGPLSPDFTGIDPNLMDSFITEMEHARSIIGEHTEAIRRIFTAKDIPAASLTPIAEIEAWIDQKLPDLRRRIKLAHATARLPSWSPDIPTGLVPYDETSDLPLAEARRLGIALAAEYKKIDPDALFQSDRTEICRKILEGLASHIHDPEFTAAFFTALGLDGTLRLPVILREHLQPGEEATLAPPRPRDETIRTVSQAFATAVSAGSHVPGFSRIIEALQNSNLSSRSSFGGSLLLSAGTFPPEWLARVVTARGLAIPNKIDSGYLYALANNPAAARFAMEAVTTGNATKLTTFLQQVSERTTGPYATDAEADAFGRLLAAASGAYDEEDGKHSKDAAALGFTIMTTMGDLKIGQAMRVHLSEIAGAYATEITEGANLSDEDRLLPSRFGDVTSQTPGLTPMFHLSPEDTYRFIKTFADSTENQMPFREGMGNLASRLIKTEVPVMMRSNDPTRLDNVFAALGNVTGLQLAATEKIGKAKDDAEEQASKAFSWVSGNMLGAVGLAVPGMAGAVFWTALSTEWSTIDTYKPEKEKEVEKIRSADDLATLGRQHAIAQSLMDAGFKPKVSPHDYQATCPPGVAISDDNGNLRPFADIAKSGDKGLVALDRWFLENGMNGVESQSLGGRSDHFATTHEGRKIRAKSRALQFDIEN
ncbi:hypothetical protein Skr01_26220 [Sphaerisporangium krabiense]|uniref:DUF6571 domain-containing protein n=1 Tax=Sphaerisporangium krabiense TaxID=763782 RepID=A0A7W8ZAJ7_9ACTN|nr:DUF6571 family protein [Sphaerisporangium krabiense]MBB5630509.1 hypothetical protein [Sphaerisporangium krabiense]GII62537.1 hypothetical protein Skr01_26220 [Sphaerisporangium krabiense]